MTAMAKPVRVVLADDHTLVRSGIRALLAQQMPQVEVVGEAGDGRQVLELVRTLRPDLVLLDIAMPGLNGLTTTARLAREHPATRVLILSTYGAEDYVIQAFHDGAAGYLLKKSAADELTKAVLAVMRGEKFLCANISKHVAALCLEHANGRPLTRRTLPVRQREVLQLVAEGRSNKEVASLLGVSIKTVGTHREHLMRALGIHDATGLVRYAIRTGLISPED